MADGCIGTKGRKLQFRIFGLFPMGKVGQPNQCGSQHRPNQLGEDVTRHLRPCKAALTNRCQSHGNSRIEMGSADGTHHVNAQGNSKPPPQSDDQPASLLTLGLVEKHTSDNTIPQEDEHHRSKAFCEVWIHGNLWYAKGVQTESTRFKTRHRIPRTQSGPYPGGIVA